jgi:hypothetical protein
MPTKEEVVANLRRWREKDVESFMVAIDIVRIQRGIPFGELREICGEALTQLEEILSERVNPGNGNNPKPH